MIINYRGGGKPPIPILERFWAKVDCTGPVPEDRPELGPCWLWTGSVTSEGYGQLSHYGKNLSVHRLAYELHQGAIPTGLQLDHLCRVRHCANHDHLEAVSRRTNLLRGAGVGAKAARKTHCPQGHPYSGGNLRLEEQPSGYLRRRCRACNRKAQKKHYWMVRAS